MPCVRDRRRGRSAIGGSGTLGPSVVGCLTASTRIRRADNDADVGLGQLVTMGARDLPVCTIDRLGRVIAGVVSKAFFTGVRPTFAMVLSSGRVLEATANHPFFTIDGWLRVDELALGDPIASVPTGGSAEMGWDTVASIEPLGPRPVYDITVPGTHNFLANGLVAHNSMPID
jgi:replicative DNA helicase